LVQVESYQTPTPNLDSLVTLFPGFRPGGGGLLATPALPPVNAGDVMVCANPVTRETEWSTSDTIRAAMGLGPTDSPTFAGLAVNGTVNAGAIDNPDAALVLGNVAQGVKLKGATRWFTESDNYVANLINVNSDAFPVGRLILHYGTDSTNVATLSALSGKVQVGGKYYAEIVTGGVTRMRASSTGVDVTGDATFSGDVDVAGQITQSPPALVTLTVNSTLSIETTSDTAGNIVFRGSDGITRRSAITFV